MMVVLQLSEWLKDDEFPKSQELTVKFLDAGEYVEKEFEGKVKQQFEIRVEAGSGEVRKWSMNLTSQRAVAQRLGSGDTSTWVGHSAELYLQTENVAGKMRVVIYARDGLVVKAVPELKV